MAADAEQAHDAARRRAAENPGDERRRAGAFDDDVGRKLVDVVDRAGEIKRAEVADELRLRPIRRAVEHIDLVVALLPHQRREQADRAGAGHQHPPRLPGVEAPADALDVIPGLGDDARRLQQHAELAERRIDLDGVARLDAKPLGAEAVQALDAALGVAAVAAHVPFADGAGRAGHRVGPPHDADDAVADGEARCLPAPRSPRHRIHDRAPAARCRAALRRRRRRRFPGRCRRRRAQRANQDRAIRLRRLWDVFELGGVGHPGKKRDRAQVQTLCRRTREICCRSNASPPRSYDAWRPEKFPGQESAERCRRSSRSALVRQIGLQYSRRHRHAANRESPPTIHSRERTMARKVLGTKDSGPKVDRRKFLTGVAVAGAASAVAPQAANATGPPAPRPRACLRRCRRPRWTIAAETGTPPKDDGTASAASPAPTSWSTSSRRSTSNTCRRTALRASAASTSR